MQARIRQQLARRKRRIERRLDKSKLGNIDQPVFTARSIDYEIADRTHGIASGGIGAMHELVHRVGLAKASDQRLHLLKL